MGRRGKLARIARVALLATIPIATACSFFVSTDADQCSTTADCTSKGGAFANAVCTADHVCIDNVCSSNAQCISAHAGEDGHWICRHADQACAKLESQDCTTLLADPADLTNDATLWLGTLLPTTGDNASEGLPNQNGVEVARRDFKTAASGLPPAKSGGPQRPLAFVACTDADDADRAASHLVNDVKVPAIIGPAFSGVLIKVAHDVTVPGGTLIITPSATSPYITTQFPTSPRLVWRTCPSDTEQSVAMSDLIKTTIEPALRDPTNGPLKSASDQMKLAVVNKGDAYGEGLASALFDVVVFNGKSGKDNGANYKQIDYGDPAAPDADTKYTNAINQLVAFAPHVVVVIGTVEAVTKIYTPLEAAWTNTSYRPRWLLSDGAEIPEVLAAVGTNVDLRHRTLGTVPGVAPSSANYSKFAKHYSSIITDGTSPDQYTAAAYDAAYLLGYAAVALGDVPLTGAAFDDGLKKMVPPGKLEVAGIDAIPDALNELQLGHNIDYDGASGPLDFDVDHGEAQADIQVWCVGLDGGGANQLSLSGMYYSAVTKNLQGTINCP